MEMNMNNIYQIAICDDESKILNDISHKIKEAFQQIEISADYFCTEDSKQMMEYLQKKTVDVIFLDIDMPVFSGMDIAAYLNEKHPNSILIFVTSYDALVYQSFAYRPFGFIRKTHLEEELQELIACIGKELSNRKREIVISKGQELIRILLQDILYIEAEGNYLHINTKKEVVRIRETMTNMEKELLGKAFIRCHKGYLINAEHVQKLRNAEVDLKLDGIQKTIPVGRSYEKEVRRKIIEMLR